MIAVITTQNGWFLVQTPFRYDVKEAMKTVPGAKWIPSKKVWAYPASAYVAESLTEIFKWKNVDIQADAGFKTMSKVEPEKKAKLEPIKLDKNTPKTIPKTTNKPFKHQVDAFWLMAKNLGDAE